MPDLAEALADGRGLHIYHSRSLGRHFKVVQDRRDLGVVLLEHEWSVERSPGQRPAGAARGGDG